MRNTEKSEPHYDIWSIPSRKGRWYVTLLLTSGSALCGYLIYRDVNNPEYATGQALARAILTDSIVSYTGAAIGSLVLIQWGEMIMVLTHFLREQTRKLKEQREERERQREQTLAQGRNEGRAEAQAEWLAWNRRRLVAEQAGQPFDEPPPASVQNGRHNPT